MRVRCASLACTRGPAARARYLQARVRMQGCCVCAQRRHGVAQGPAKTVHAWLHSGWQLEERTEGMLMRGSMTLAVLKNLAHAKSN